jgi:segregation and condensation protein B
MTDPTPFDDDLESAYRAALRAVEATDLPGLDGWQTENPEETRGDDDSPDILPMNPAWAAAPAARPEAPAPVPVPAAEPTQRVTPRQVLEAAVFVGGVELTGEKLASILKGEFTPEFVARTLDDLNRRYAAQNRPYEIRCEEGLYRLALRPDHEPLRRRVFGLGPKEVKLGQEALEILSLIAYRQPITRAAIEAAREGNAGNVLRQLVRRQLVALKRDDGDEEIRYVTTPRFLEVFGLADLEELPRAEDLTFK